MADGPQFLLARGDDLVVLGMRWSDMHVRPPSEAGGAPSLIPGADARITLTFPPQHVGEQVGDEGDLWPPAPHRPGPPFWGSLRGQMSPWGTVAAVVSEGTEIVDLFAVTDDGLLSWRRSPGAGWQAIGPELSSRTPIAAVERWMGTIELFALDDDGTLLSRAFVPAQPGDEGRWSPLMGGFASGTPVTVTSRLRGYVDAFAVRDGVLWNAWGLPDHSRGAASLGGSFAPGTRVAAVNAPTISPDTIEVHLFAIDTSGRLSWRAPGASWVSLGAPNAPLPQGGQVAAVAFGWGSIDVFVVGVQRTVYQRRLRRGDRWEDSWIAEPDWISLGGDFAPGAPIVATTTPRPLRTTWGEGIFSDGTESPPPMRIHLAVADGDRIATATWADEWSIPRCGWLALGNRFTEGAALSAVCAHSGRVYEDVDQDGLPVTAVDGGLIELFAVASDRELLQLSWYGLDSRCWGVWEGIVGAIERRQARLAGPSSVEFKLEGSQPVPLSVVGVLDACRRATITSGTAIELPWRLRMAPRARSGAGPAACRHDADALRSTSGTVSTWNTAIVAQSAPTADDAQPGAAPSAPGADLELTPVDGVLADTPDDIDVPLAQGQRSRIFQLGRDAPPQARRLELSALGGTLSARGSWSSLDWEHDATLGRDMRVRLVSRGVLYPFGHQVSFVEFTERRFTSRASRGVAALGKSTALFVTEPMRGPAPYPEFRRAFPFDTVEILAHAFTGLAGADWVKVKRPSELVQLQSHLAALEVELSAWGGFPAEPGSVTDPEIAKADIRERMRIARDRVERLGGAGHPGLEPTSLFFWPHTSEGELLRFPVSCSGRGQPDDVRFSIPLMFVALPPPDPLTEHDAVVRLADEWHARAFGEVPLARTAIDLVRGAERMDGDVHEVSRINLGCAARGGSFRARLGPSTPPAAAAAGEPAHAWAAEVAVPALRRLLNEVRPPVPVSFDPDFLSRGVTPDIVLRTLPEQEIVADFTGSSDRSGGLVAPKLAHDAFSRTLGLVNTEALLSGSDRIAPAKLLRDGSKLLGISLLDLMPPITGPVKIVTLLGAGEAPTTRMRWSDVRLVSKPPIERMAGAAVSPTLALSVEVAPSGTTTTCTVRDFMLRLPPTGDLLRLNFNSLTFRQAPGRSPALGSSPRPTPAQPDPPFVDKLDVKVDFGSKLEFLEALQERVLLGDGPQVAVTASGIVASYVLPVPDVQVGAFSLRNLVFRAAVEVPFTGGPTSLTLAFATVSSPFNLSVLMFGGGGYIEIKVDNEKLRRLEAVLEFGASLAVNFGIAAGEVHALGGVRYVWDDLAGASITGYVRFGGSVEVLGLVSVSIELRVELTYDDERRRLFGSATLVIEVDLTLISESVEIPSGEWELIGGDPPASAPPAPAPAVDAGADARPALLGAVSGARAGARGGFDAWKVYRDAFAAR